MQTRQRTLWTFSSRTLDSREVLDSTNNGLKRGRIDVPASLMVKVEGYDTIEYVTTFSDGTSSKTDTFEKAIASNGKPVVETISGSGIMTFFIDETGSATRGINKVDVVKTWGDVDPEPEPEPINPVVRMVGSFHAGGFGINAYHADGVRNSIKFGAFEVNLALPQTDTILDLNKKFANLDKRLRELEGKPTA